MDTLVISIASAFFCVISRAFLNSIDRTILRMPRVDFLTAMHWNAIFPLVFALLTALWFGSFKVSYLLHPGVILSGLGAQVAGTVYSSNLKQMPVRNVMVVNKSADLLIPLAVFLITHKLSVSDYLFSGLTTLAFLPIAFVVLRSRDFFPPASLYLVGALLFQAVVTHLFSLPELATDWKRFSNMMACILFWRAVSILGILLFRYLKDGNGVNRVSVDVLTALAGRGFLAYLSQAAFYLGITRSTSAIVWPIINAGPLISCFLAHLLLKEKTGYAEKKALFQYSLVAATYITYAW